VEVRDDAFAKRRKFGPTCRPAPPRPLRSFSKAQRKDETDFGAPEKGNAVTPVRPKKLGRAPNSTSRGRKSLSLTAILGIQESFQSVVGGGTSRFEPFSMGEFPANREKNRDFGEIGSILIANQV
jgi:hypothetical protein